MDCRGNSHTLPLITAYPKQEETYLASPKERCFLLYYPSKRKDDFLLPWQQPSQWEIVITQTMKSHYTLNSQFPSVDSLFITTCFFLYKKKFLSFVLQNCLWFCHSLHVPNYNSLLFLNEPIFASKTIALFLRSTMSNVSPHPRNTFQ